MKYWREYYSHDPEILGKKKKFDNTIYTFDIETTNSLILNNKIVEASHYLELTEKEQKDCTCVANMYIWMFGINENVYYGRTWNELYNFLSYIDNIVPEQKICYVHNLPFEFQFMQNIFDFEYVFARKKRKPIKLQLADFNFEFRCSLILTNSKLDKLPDTYGLKVRKLTGNLDYNVLRNSKTNLSTNLSTKELAYCENDCLVVYEYIKKELETYKTLKKIPLTNTGHVRQELKEKVMKNYSYRHKVSKSVNTDPHVYNLLTQAFMRRLHTWQLDIRRCNS